MPGAPDRSNSTATEKAMTSKCGENQQQNEQNLVTTSGALKRSNSTATKKQVASNEGEFISRWINRRRFVVPNR